MAEPDVLRVERLTKHFTAGVIRRTPIRAVDDVSFTLAAGETLGIVGESGCGKTTLARSLVMLDRPTSGKVVLDGTDLCHLRGSDLRMQRRTIQMVFQDPYASLSPQLTVEQIIAEGWTAHRDVIPTAERRERTERLLTSVGLGTDALDRYAHQFSGGQRQRIGIARALALDPKVMICDEPTSALDVSIQAQVINLLRDIQRDRRLSMIFIGHDLSVIRHVSDRIAVMYLGQIVEIGNAEEIFRHQRHPYTKALLSASPRRGSSRTEKILLAGDVPSPANPPTGCRFRTRCWKAQDVCARTEPALSPATDQPAACHFPE